MASVLATIENQLVDFFVRIDGLSLSLSFRFVFVAMVSLLESVNRSIVLFIKTGTKCEGV